MNNAIKEQLLMFIIKTLNRNAISVETYTIYDNTICLDYTYTWTDLSGNITRYYPGVKISKKEFNSFIRDLKLNELLDG